MKDFIKKFFNDSTIRWIIKFFIIPFATIWTLVWSLTDGYFNYVPILIGVGIIAFIFIMSWIFRNNE